MSTTHTCVILCLDIKKVEYLEANSNKTTKKRNGRKYIFLTIWYFIFLSVMCCLLWIPPSARSPYLPHDCLQVISCCGQADTQHNGVRRRGQNAGDDGFTHGEWQHGVNNEHNKQEERNLLREKDILWKKNSDSWGKSRLEKRNTWKRTSTAYYTL